MMTFRILILGGTTEARQLGERLGVRDDLAVTMSLAGRTANPVGQPVPMRSGGFGGADGLAQHLRDQAVDLLVDATHPFAARISANAMAASRKAGVPLLVLRRAAWQATEGDRWSLVDTIPAAVKALGEAPRRVFVTLGRQELQPLQHAPQHFYLIRSVDPVLPRPDLPDAAFLLDRGPFELESEIALLRSHGIDAIVSKNSGGDAAYAKIAAARTLGLPVILVRRPPGEGPQPVSSVAEALAAIDHLASPEAKRGE